MVCNQCNKEKPEDEMKIRTRCIECDRKNKKEYDSLRYQENRDSEIKRSKLTYEKIKQDPEKLEKRRNLARESSKLRIQTPERKQKAKETKAKYRKNNRDKINFYTRTRRKNNEQFRLSSNLRRQLAKVIKKQGIQKTWRGEISQELTNAILKKLGPRPDNSHHLDHIIPLVAFDLTKKEHRLLANSPENLRWLPGEENLSKNDFIDFPLIKSEQELLNIAKTIGLIDFE